MKLPLEDANYFIELMWGLQRYANRQFHICKDISSPLDYAGLPVNDKLKLNDALWKSSDLINDYLESTPKICLPKIRKSYNPGHDSSGMNSLSFVT